MSSEISRELRALMAKKALGNEEHNMIMVVAMALIAGAVLFFAVKTFLPQFVNPSSPIMLTWQGIVIVLIGAILSGYLAYEYL